MSCYSPQHILLNEKLNSNLIIKNQFHPGPEKITSITKGLKNLIWGKCEYPQILKVGGMTYFNNKLIITDVLKKNIITFDINSNDCEDINISSYNFINEPTDIESSENYIYILDKPEAQLYKLNKSFNLIEIISLPFSKNPTKVKIINQNIFIIDTQSNAIFVLNLNGNLIKTITSIENEQKIYPIDIYPSNENSIFIIDGIKREIVQLDKNLNFISHKISFENSLPYPNMIQINELGFIFINDFVSNKINIYYPNGNLFATINNQLINQFSSSHLEQIDHNSFVIFNPKTHSIYIMELKS
jgi:hypothetical protein